MRWHDAVASDPVGDLGAVVAPDEVEAEVDAGGGARGGEHVTVVDEQDVGVDRHAGKLVVGRYRSTSQCVVAGRPSRRPIVARR